MSCGVTEPVSVLTRPKAGEFTVVSFFVCHLLLHLLKCENCLKHIEEILMEVGRKHRMHSVALGKPLQLIWLQETMYAFRYLAR